MVRTSLVLALLLLGASSYANDIRSTKDSYKAESAISHGRTYTCALHNSTGKSERVELRITLDSEDRMKFQYHNETFFQRGQFDKTGISEDGKAYESHGFSDSKNAGLGKMLIFLSRYTPKDMTVPVVVISITDSDKDLPALRGICASKPS